MLKTWKILTKLRCCPRRATAIVQAILVLHHVEANRYTGCKRPSPGVGLARQPEVPTT